MRETIAGKLRHAEPRKTPAACFDAGGLHEAEPFHLLHKSYAWGCAITWERADRLVVLNPDESLALGGSEFFRVLSHDARSRMSAIGVSG